jgi:hypothetical protein
MISTTENAGGRATTNLTDIELLTQAFATKHDRLVSVMSDLQAEQAALLKKFLPRLRAAVADAAAAKLTLHTAIAGAPALFDKPKTQIFHGVKVGFRKGSGGIDWDDDAAVVERIEKLFTKPQADLLIKTTKKPIAKALEDLDGAELKKLGCRVESTGDVVVIKPTDSEIEKAVAALLKDAVEVEVQS